MAVALLLALSTDDCYASDRTHFDLSLLVCETMARDVSSRGSGSKSTDELGDDLQMLMDGIIDEEFIRQETGQTNLDSIIHLSLVIDTSRQSVYDLHVILPNLQHLVLDGSVLSSVRDLGIGLRFLRSLSLSSCGLIDIDGIGVLTGLQDLCLSDNAISDVTPLAMHENLQNLNLSGNRIADISIADSLSSCLALRSLSLSRNPLCKARNYRLIIASLISTLQMLDGTPVDPDAAKKVNNGMILESAAELKMVEEDMDDEMRLENELLMGQSATTSVEVVNKSATAGVAAKYTEGIPDTGSELTHGSTIVLAGNAAAAVRRRRGTDTRAGSGKGSMEADPAEYESTLDILDAALGRGESKSASSSRPGSQRERGLSQEKAHGASFYKEGDVTAALMGSSALHSSLRLSTEAGEDGEERAAILHSASSPQVSGRDSWSARRNHSGEFSFREAAPSPALRGSSQRSAGRRGDAADMSMSFDAEIARPRTAASSTTSGSFRLATSAAVGSPRQRNSSRPQSAASVGSGVNSPQTGRLASSQAAPFKVAVDKQSSSGSDDNSTPAAGAAAGLVFPNIKGAAKPNKTTGSIVHLDIVKRPTGSYVTAEDDEIENIPGGAAQADDEDSDTEDIAVTHAARHQLMFASSTAGCTNSTTSALKARQQILQRLKSTSTKTEEATQDRYASPPLARAPRAQPAPAASSAAHGSPRLEVGIAERGSARKGRLEEECEIESLENSPQRPRSANKNKVTSGTSGTAGTSKETQSSKAGMSLGFHLAGSLAAIDKWVQDMNSEDEEGDADESEREGDHRDRHAPSGSNSARGPDLESHGPQGASGLEGHSKDSCSDVSATSRGSRSKILTRDTILSMCSSSGRDAGAAAALDEDSDLDEPDLQLPVEKSSSSSRSTTAVRATTEVDPTVERSSFARSTAGSRSRNADVLNRVGSRSSSRSRASARVEQSAPAAADEAPVATERPRPRPRAVPDFPNTQESATSSRPSGAPAVGSAVLSEDGVSPPRHTVTPVTAPSIACGPGVALPDAELVELLKQKPKNTLVLRTTSSFQEYFSGIATRRMCKLLEMAYADVADPAERKEKVDKRLKLLSGLMI